MTKIENDVAKAEEQRKTDLADLLKPMKDDEIDAFAKSEGIDLSACKSRDDKVAAIELAMEKKAAGQRLKDADDAAAAAVKSETASRSPQTISLHRLDADFCANVPQAARSGDFRPAKDDERFVADIDAADGKYRRAGSQWVFEIRKKRLVHACRATAANGYGGKGVVAV